MNSIFSIHIIKYVDFKTQLLNNQGLMSFVCLSIFLLDFIGKFRPIFSSWLFCAMKIWTYEKSEQNILYHTYLYVDFQFKTLFLMKCIKTKSSQIFIIIKTLKKRKEYTKINSFRQWYSSTHLKSFINMKKLLFINFYNAIGSKPPLCTKGPSL